MTFIIIVLMALLLLVKGTFFKSNNDKTNRNFLVFATIVFTLFLGCRNAVAQYGTDLNNYYRFYERAISSKDFELFYVNSFEKGYVLINWLFSRIIKWPQFILFFQAAFCCGITFKFIYKHSNDILVSVFGFMAFGLMLFYLTGFRQSIAISICLLAFEAAEKKKLIRFLIFVAIAFSIHQTAIVFLAVYYLVNLRLTKFSIALDFAIGICTALLVPRIIAVGNDFFDKEYVVGFVGNQLGGIINVFVALVPIVVVLINRNVIVENIQSQESYTDDVMLNHTYLVCSRMIHVLLVGIAFYLLRFEALVLERISLYYTPVLFVLLPHCLGLGFDAKSKKIATLIMYMGMIFLIIWRTSSMSYIPFWMQT